MLCAVRGSVDLFSTTYSDVHHSHRPEVLRVGIVCDYLHLRQRIISHPRPKHGHGDLFDGRSFWSNYRNPVQRSSGNEDVFAS